MRYVRCTANLCLGVCSLPDESLYFLRSILQHQLFVFAVGHNVTDDLLTTELERLEGI